jgi:hypothetical protein
MFGTRPTRTKSRVTNHNALLPGIDGRSAAARRFRDIVAALAGDQGGVEHMSEARLQLVRRFAAAAVLAEQLEARLTNGEPINITEHALLCSTLCRVSNRIGLRRIPKNITPTLAEILDDSASDEP